MAPTHHAEPDWRTIGLFWGPEHPRWVAAAPGRPERPLDLRRGAPVRTGLEGPRVCVGRWDPERRRHRWCSSPVPAGIDAQCPGCAANDRGRRLARDAHTDDRDYLLYLA